MRVPIEWLREVTGLPADIDAETLAARLTEYDLKLEEIIGASASGPLVVGRVLQVQPEPQKNGKTINWCRVDVGEHNLASVPDAPGPDVASRGIVCGARNFGVGDLVVVALPGSYLRALDLQIASRRTYGHISDGMICSASELDLPDPGSDEPGIMVLAPDSAEPGTEAIGLLGIDAEVLELEINPDRSYALSLRGVGRDTALAFGLDFTDPAERLADSAAAPFDAYPVWVDDRVACPVFTAGVVTGVDPGRPTPDWMARRLQQSGMRPLSLAVDISNYVMLELGQPTHAYDRAKLNGALGVRRAVVGERLTTLDGQERELYPDDLLICDDSGPIGLAGVLGGARTEIDAASTDLVIEAAHFDAAVVFGTGRRHRITSEAGKRNARGVDPLLPAIASRRVAELLAEFGGGTILPGPTVLGEAAPIEPISLEAGLVSQVIGLPVEPDQVSDALRANGCIVTTGSANLFSVQPPSWRLDLVDPYDLVEEVLRVVGYDQIPSVLPEPSGGRGATRSQVLRRRVGQVLAGAGLTEVITFPFAGSDDFDRLGFAAEDQRREQVRLSNPLSAQEPGLTTTLLAGLLRALELNVGRGHDDVALSELGRVFAPRNGVGSAPIYGVDAPPSAEQLAKLDAALPAQPWHVAWAMSGNRVRHDWSGRAREASWADAIEIGQRIAGALHLDLAVGSARLAPFHPGRCAAFRLQGEVIGYAGELHPRVTEAYNLPDRAVAGELDLDALLQAAPQRGPRPEFSTYPVVKEDLAFVVSEQVPAGDLQELLAGASPLVESVRPFDVYTGEQLGEGYKSIAFAVRLRAADRTLSEQEIGQARAELVAAAGSLGASLRA